MYEGLLSKNIANLLMTHNYTTEVDQRVAAAKNGARMKILETRGIVTEDHLKALHGYDVAITLLRTKGHHLKEFKGPINVDEELDYWAARAAAAYFNEKDDGGVAHITDVRGAALLKIQSAAHLLRSSER